jgi:undecaprenyl diphosphate synthase
MPEHIAIIMDGNGRWAKQKGLSRIRGHNAGANTVREIVEECARLKIKQLTLYAFSTENKKRPSLEVNFLMRLLRNYLVKERERLMKNDIRFVAIGRLNELPSLVQKELNKTTEMTAGNKGTVLCLALNYGSRTEITDAVKKIAAEVKNNSLSPDKINEEIIKKHLYQPEMKDPDLLIRTANEMRISNFLLWQISYTELWITPVLWPDFTKEHLNQAINDYSKRERRFGGI